MLLRKLENEYTVIAEKTDDGRGQMAGTIVLAVREVDAGGQYVYATWWCRASDGATFQGNYFHSYSEGSVENAFFKAVTDFIIRKS